MENLRSRLGDLRAFAVEFLRSALADRAHLVSDSTTAMAFSVARNFAGLDRERCSLSDRPGGRLAVTFAGA